MGEHSQNLCSLHKYDPAGIVRASLWGIWVKLGQKAIASVQGLDSFIECALTLKQPTRYYNQALLLNHYIRLFLQKTLRFGI